LMGISRRSSAWNGCEVAIPTDDTAARGNSSYLFAGPQ
jgi:hypothetical protein